MNGDSIDFVSAELQINKHMTTSVINGIKNEKDTSKQVQRHWMDGPKLGIEWYQ
jgi:hypothetical protein